MYKGHTCTSRGALNLNFHLNIVWRWELDHSKDWALKNLCFWTVALEKTLECPLNSKEIKTVNPKEYQPQIFIGRTDAKPEAPILWPTDEKSWFTGKDPDAGKDWGQEEKRATKDKSWMASLTQWTWVWQNEGDSEGQGSPVCCSSWGHRELETTWQLNNNVDICYKVQIFKFHINNLKLDNQNPINFQNPFILMSHEHYYFSIWVYWK